MRGRNFIAALLAAMFAVAFAGTQSVLAHDDDIEYQDPGYGMGYGMEPDTMDEYCPGCGMMGGDGTAPGMMGSQGTGHGMMGGYGMGPGMMGGMMHGLELTSEQQKQMARIDTDLRKKNWMLQGEIIDARGELFELYADEMPDSKKIGAVYGKIFDLRRKMIEATIDARNRQRSILTDEQLEKLRDVHYERRNGNYERSHREMDHHHGHHMM